MSTIGFHRRASGYGTSENSQCTTIIAGVWNEFGNAHAKPIQGKLWELRPGGIRLFYFAYIENQFVIFHGYRKQSQKAPGREIEIALCRMEELKKEVKNGS